jgi:cytochrome c-type protein NapC/trimethylamine-N-oxide reductase cytochrome c-type subunit TorC
VLAAVLGFVAITVGFAYAAASPALCATCHEMQPKVEAWEVSGHAKVGCVSCHETPRSWTQFPQTLGERASLLARDIGLHLTRSTADADTPHDGMQSDIPDSTCERCHHPAREVSMRYGTLIDHEDHAERNDSCVSCHLWTAHPDPGIDRALLTMSQCFSCHGHTAEAEAPGTCDTCHPDDFELKPASHEPELDWASGHGQPSIDGNQDCEMCHEAETCTDCHGVAMPHPEEWTEGDSLHVAVAQQDDEVCVACHEPAEEFCAPCHHKGYDSVEGAWLDVHQDSVRERGAGGCFDCHEPTHCVTCHTTFPPQGPGTRQ